MSEGLPPIPVVCAICQSPHGKVVHTIPLCTSCRERHLQFAIPNFLKIAGIFFLLVFVYTTVRLPSELCAAIVWDQGQAAWDDKNYVAAERDYKAALAYFPQSSSVLGKVARSARANGDIASFDTAMDTLGKLSKTDSDAALEIAHILMEKAPTRP